jgi:hypothetical protein
LVLLSQSGQLLQARACADNAARESGRTAWDAAGTCGVSGIPEKAGTETGAAGTGISTFFGASVRNSCQAFESGIHRPEEPVFAIADINCSKNSLFGIVKTCLSSLLALYLI